MIRPSRRHRHLDALVELANTPAVGEGRRVIVLITDGYDEHSQSALRRGGCSVRKSAVTLYVIGLGGVAGISLKGEHLLRSLRPKRAAAWFPRGRGSRAAYSTIAAADLPPLSAAYTPQNQVLDGQWRTIT